MQPTIDPVTLRLYIAICEDGSFVRAAEREALVPSALSKRMTALESDLGVSLLVRRRRGVEPTPAGLNLLRQAREVLASMDRIRAEIRGSDGGAQGSVRVVASPSALAERLPSDISFFLTRYPAVRVTLDERLMPDLVRDLREGAADVSILWDRADLSGLRVTPYREDRLCVAVAASHPLARRKSLCYEETLDYDSISVAAGGMLDTMLRRQAGLFGRLPEHRIQVSSINAACHFVAAGFGLAFLPRSDVSRERVPRVRLVPLRDSWAVRRIVVCTRPEPLLSASARLLVEHLRSKDPAAAPVSSRRR